MTEILQEFIDKKSKLPKLIVIYGPTACGKTTLSIDIAKKINSEIISADSRQIYIGLNIGTGKVTPTEMNGIIHHMIDIISIDKNYSVGEYKSKAENIIDLLHIDGKIPVICGGTGLYIDSIIYNFNIPNVVSDWQYRDQLEKIRLDKGNKFIWEMLNKIDPEYAKILSPNNYRYIIRGLEIFEKTGKSKLELKQKNELKYDVLFMTPYDGNREKLYNNINSRIEKMFNLGLVEEVKDLLKKYPETSFGFNSIGYKEIISHLNGNLSINKSIDLVKQHNRNYAKRQLTWFKKYMLK